MLVRVLGCRNFSGFSEGHGCGGAVIAALTVQAPTLPRRVDAGILQPLDGSAAIWGQPGMIADPTCRRTRLSYLTNPTGAQLCMLAGQSALEG